jgi:hypothetical protein
VLTRAMCNMHVWGGDAGGLLGGVLLVHGKMPMECVLCSARHVLCCV